MQVVIVSSLSVDKKLVDALHCFGIRAQWCDRLTDASELIELYGFDLVIIDVAFAGGSYKGIKAFRITHKTLPIVVLGAEITREQVLSCLSAGADDVVRWPSDAEIIAARIRAIVRRCRGADAAVLQIGPLRFDMIHRSLQVNNLPVTLTGKEYSILEYMVTHKGMILTKDALLNQLYGGKDAPGGRIIDVFVCKLRKKLAECGVHELIETVRGLGYMLNEHACRFIQRTSAVGAIVLDAAQVA